MTSRRLAASSLVAFVVLIVVGSGVVLVCRSRERPADVVHVATKLFLSDPATGRWTGEITVYNRSYEARVLSVVKDSIWTVGHGGATKVMDPPTLSRITSVIDDAVLGPGELRSFDIDLFMISERSLVYLVADVKGAPVR